MGQWATMGQWVKMGQWVTMGHGSQWVNGSWVNGSWVTNTMGQMSHGSRKVTHGPLWSVPQWYTVRYSTANQIENFQQIYLENHCLVTFKAKLIEFTKLSR